MSETLIPLSWLLGSLGGCAVLIIILLILVIQKTSDADYWHESAKNWRSGAEALRREVDTLRQDMIRGRQGEML